MPDTRLTRLLLFDIDGTLLLCRGRGMRAMHHAIQQLFAIEPVESGVKPQGKTDPVLFEEVGAAHGIDAERIAARTPELHATYLTTLASSLAEPEACEVKPGVTSLLDTLVARPEVALGLVSGNLEPAAWLKLAAAGLDRYFATGAFGSDARRRSDLVALAMARCVPPGSELGPESVWVIGDTPDDVAGGRAHGTRTLAVATGSFERHELERARPDWVLDSFASTGQVVDILCGGG